VRVCLFVSILLPPSSTCGLVYVIDFQLHFISVYCKWMEFAFNERQNNGSFSSEWSELELGFEFEAEMEA